MAGPLLQPLLLLLLPFALGSAAQAAQGNGERIINGAVCPRGTHPWQVALYHNDEFQCAGVLIHPQWVLTVAHCRRSEYIVQMGSDLLVGGRAQTIEAAKSFVHPRYNNRTDDHDLMLLKLSGPATLSPHVKTIDIPSSCKVPGASCTVSGWGIALMVENATNPTELMCSDVNLVSYKRCRKVHRAVLKKYMICAVAPGRRSSTCRGDSGGPLMCQGSLQGLVSGGYFPCRPPFEPVIYTRVCMYRKWIYNTMKTYS